MGCCLIDLATGLEKLLGFETNHNHRQMVHGVLDDLDKAGHGESCPLVAFLGLLVGRPQLLCLMSRVICQVQGLLERGLLRSDFTDDIDTFWWDAIDDQSVHFTTFAEAAQNPRERKRIYWHFVGLK